MEAAKNDERRDPRAKPLKELRQNTGAGRRRPRCAHRGIYALVGANGAGKTTLIKLLMNILRPTSGGATVLGIDSRRLAGSQFSHIGYVSENQELPEWMTVGYMLDYLRPFYPQWDRALEQQLIRQFRSAAQAQAQTPIARNAHEGRFRQRARLSPAAHPS